MADILFYVSYDNRMFHYRNRYNSQALLIVFYDWKCQKPGLLPDLQPQKTCECAGMTATASQRHYQVQNRPQMHLAPPVQLPPSAKSAPNALGTTVTTAPKCKIGPKCTWHHRYDCPQVQKRPQMHVAPPLRLPPSAKTAPNALGTTGTEEGYEPETPGALAFLRDSCYFCSRPLD